MTRYTFERLQPEYAALWGRMTVTRSGPAASQARRIIANKARYKTVQDKTGVPWFVVGCMHMRESNGNFNTYLGNGEPLTRRTRLVPKGRGPFSSFEDGAVDALVDVEHLDRIKNWEPAHVAYALETFNGFGYRYPSRNIPSPYLWGGTSVQKRGKFVRDGVYDRTVMDSQIGGMAVLQMLISMDPEARFVAPPSLEEQQDNEVEDETSGKAVDIEDMTKPMVKSKTVWGGIWQYLTTGGAAILAFIQGLPPWLIAAILAAGLVGLYLVIKGRIDVDKVVRHLSDEE